MNNGIKNKRTKNQIGGKEIKEKNDKNLIKNQNISPDKNLVYNMIEIYEYKTIKKNMTNGVKNHINEFEKKYVKIL